MFWMSERTGIVADGGAGGWNIADIIKELVRNATEESGAVGWRYG